MDDDDVEYRIILPFDADIERYVGDPEYIMQMKNVTIIFCEDPSYASRIQIHFLNAWIILGGTQPTPTRLCAAFSMPENFLHFRVSETEIQAVWKGLQENFLQKQGKPLHIANTILAQRHCCDSGWKWQYSRQLRLRCVGRAAVVYRWTGGDAGQGAAV